MSFHHFISRSAPPGRTPPSPPDTEPHVECGGSKGGAGQCIPGRRRRAEGEAEAEREEWALLKWALLNGLESGDVDRRVDPQGPREPKAYRRRVNDTSDGEGSYKPGG